MNNQVPLPTDGSNGVLRTIDIVNRGLSKRYRSERRFRRFGLAAILASLVFLAFLFASIVIKGYSAFQQTYVKVDISFEPQLLSQEALANADYGGLVKQSLRDMFPEVNGRREKRMLYGLVSTGAAFQLREMALKDPEIIGKRLSVWVPADDDVDMLFKGHIDRSLPEGDRRLKDAQLQWIDRLQAENRIEKRFNRTFFTAGDSRDPELAGIWGAVAGSFFTLVITLALSFPIGVASAVYLEEFAPKNRWTDSALPRNCWPSCRPRRIG